MGKNPLTALKGAGLGSKWSGAMLKKLLLNNKLVPVPVPLKTLREVLKWTETTLLKSGHTITRVILNGSTVGLEKIEQGTAAELDAILDERSKVEVRMDTPNDLAVQTLDAIHNLASVVVSGLKPQAVSCWQAKPNEHPSDVDTVHGDVKLILDLIEHLSGLMDTKQIEAAAVRGIETLLKRSEVGISMAIANSDWRACAKLFLNRLEPLLKDLIAEAETLQIRILASRGHQAAKTADQG